MKMVNGRKKHNTGVKVIEFRRLGATDSNKQKSQEKCNKDYRNHRPKVQNMEQRSGTMDQRSGTMGHRSGTMGQRSGTIRQRSGTMDQR